MAQLVVPSIQYRESCLEAAREYLDEGSQELNEALEGFDQLLEKFENWKHRHAVPKGLVPMSMFWLVEGAEYIGRVSIRHDLSPQLRQFGGHIGYTIRPSKRRMGYGSLILRLALLHARDLGIEKALITCDETNIASRKIIERNGGVYDEKGMVEGRGVPVLRYWVDTSLTNDES